MKPQSIALMFALAALGRPLAPAQAGVKLSGVFGDHMVLQRDAPVAVWGWADPGEQVVVEFYDQQKTAEADPQGAWLVRLDPLPASKEARVLHVQSAAQNPREGIAIRDVLVGDVWLCAGQSNMEWSLARSDGGPQATERADNPLLRLCTIPHNSRTTPRDDVAVKWNVSSPGAAKNFSAVAWWFGAKLQRTLDAPIGVVNDSFGGTTIQAWMPLETLRRGPWPQDKHTDFDLAKADYDERLEKIRPEVQKYLHARAEAIKEQRPTPDFPRGWPGDFRGPGTLWNGMIAPLVKLRIRGVVWHQGESNAYPGAANHYGQLLEAMIADWRTGFGMPEAPVIVVQLASHRKPQVDPDEPSGVALVQEAQANVARRTPAAALVVTRDLGEEEMNYKRKEPVAERVLRAALVLAYGRPQPDAIGPTFESATFDGGKARIRFANAGGGLVAKGGPLAGFVLAGEDRRFVFATGKIEGDTVVVSNPKTPRPVAVRYAWADFPKANLFGARGLPAAPFRSDDWPIHAVRSPASSPGAKPDGKPLAADGKASTSGQGDSNKAPVARP